MLMNQKKRRIFTIILCIILAIVLVVPMVVSLVPAAPADEISGYEETDNAEQEDTESYDETDTSYETEESDESGDAVDETYESTETTGSTEASESAETSESDETSESSELSDASASSENASEDETAASDTDAQESEEQVDVSALYHQPDSQSNLPAGGETFRAAEGVYIEDINVSGMTREEVQNAFETKLLALANAGITLHMDEETDTVPAWKMGLFCTNPEIIDLAMIIGQKGNVLRRYRADQYLAQNGSVVLTLDLTFDEKEIRKTLTGEQDHINIDPIPVKMVINDDQTMTAVDKVDGLKMQIEESAEKIKTFLDQDWHGGPASVEVVSKVVPATGDISQLADVKDLLGDGSTEYDESETGRFHNIELAAEIIDGTVLYPGEEFDFNKVVGDTTEENGFVSAGSYENGEIVESFGGGICQASTTLYRAVLEAELDVTERHPHSMTVKYVEPAFDAAIAEDVKNFRFINNTNAPIYIHGTAGGGVVRFEIYGKETRDPSRTLTFESRTISETEYTTQFVYDEEMEAGDIKSTGGRYGLVTELWKLIYENGEYVDQVQVNESEYIMAPLTYHIGTKGASEEYIARMDDAIATQSPDAVKSALGG